MDILKHIFQCNNDLIIDYYSTHAYQEIEMQIAFSLYGAARDVGSLNTLKIVCETYYRQDNSEQFKENFAKIVGNNFGLDYPFFKTMKDTDIFKEFLREYGNNIQDRVNYMETKLRSGEINIHNPITLIDLQNIKEILSEIPLAENQKRLPPYTSPYPNNWRVFDLKKTISEEHQQAIEQDLMLKAYAACKYNGVSVDEVDSIISKTKKIREDIVKHSHNNNGTFSPLLYCLHQDILKVVINKDNLCKELCHNNLWENITKYNINNVSSANFEVVELPIELKNTFNDSKVVQAIWVLKENGDAWFGGRHTLSLNKNDVHHIDLANGENVVSAGTILFSEDMRRVIAINPGSGHYQPPVESCLSMKEILDKSNFDTKNIVICDLNWKPDISDVTDKFSLPSSDKVASNFLLIRDKSLTSMKSKKLSV